MRNNKMLSLFILTTLIVGNAYATKRKPSSIDIKSAQEILFYDKASTPFSDVGKISEFQGILVQVNENSSQLASAELYKFPREERLVMTTALCNEYADKMFGPESERALKIKNTLILFSTPVGKACEYLLIDTYEHAKRPYSYVITGYVHGRLISLVWAFYKAPTTEDIEKLKSFWKTLK